MPPLTQEKVNNENMSLKDLSVAAAPPQVSAEGQAAAGRIAAARAAKDAVGTVAPSDLKPQAVVNVPQPAIPTQGASISAELEEGVDQFTQQRIDDKESKAGTKESALDTYLTNLTQQKGLTQLTDEAYRAEGGVDAITPELNDINDKIRKEQLALRRAKESIEEKGGGLAGGAATEIANLERDSFRKQADLSIIQLGIQGRYDSAKEAADRAVAAQLEQQTNYNAALKFAYDEAKSDWSVAEQREFETLLGNRNRAIEEETNRLTAIKELGIRAQIEGDAPTDVVQRMMAAETEADAMAIGGQYIGALDREQQRASIEASRASTANSYDAIAQRAEQNKAMFGTIDGKAQTDTQRTSELYANRMLEANAVIESIGDQFVGVESLVGERVPNIYKSEDRQKFEQAQRNFINAVLRKESGAVISDEEFLNAKLQYFPQPGDSVGVLSQKSQNRDTAITGLYNSANVPMPELQQDVTPTTQLQPGFQGVTTSGISYTVLPDAQ
jgi:hypothetical protein